MRIVCISDTHGQHDRLPLPEGDMLLHAGDVSKRGKRTQVAEFLRWFARQEYTHKVFIAGNHDFFFEQEGEEEIASMIPDGVVYLNDSGVELEGLRIWGSPVQPWFFDWAFNRQRGADIKKHWDLIPPDTDILLTHGPAFGILDRTVRGEAVGCQDLLHKIQVVKPKLHLSGHIHEAYGHREQEGIHYANASVLDVEYQLVHAPLVFDYDPGTKLLVRVG